MEEEEEEEAEEEVEEVEEEEEEEEEEEVEEEETLLEGAEEVESLAAGAEEVPAVEEAHRYRRMRLGRWRRHTGCKKMRVGRRRGDRKCPLNEAHRPHVRGVRAALGTNFIRVGAIGKAWRGENGRVRSSRTPIHIRAVRIQHNQCAT